MRANNFMNNLSYLLYRYTKDLELNGYILSRKIFISGLAKISAVDIF